MNTIKYLKMLKEQRAASAAKIAREIAKAFADARKTAAIIF